jgi:hypothetical protein
VVATALVLMGAGSLWWRRQVTADPHLEFRGPDVYRDEAATDHSGIVTDNSRHGFHEDEMIQAVQVAFVANGRLYATFGLYNGGGHDVRIVAVPAAPLYYWACERMTLSSDRNTGFGGSYGPLPFALHRGETRYVRLEFRMAGCDPATLQPGGYSTMDSLRLRYRILGVTRRHDVPFNDSNIEMQATGECADPLVPTGP